MRANYTQVELTLLGIDKIWVRSSNGQWKEKKIEVDSMAVSFSDDDEGEEIFSKGKKWWQFWKKA